MDYYRSVNSHLNIESQLTKGFNVHGRKDLYHILLGLLNAYLAKQSHKFYKMSQ